jgi:formate/nitrite transporter FocA (FNT family)
VPQPLPMRSTTSQTKATLTGGQIFLRAVSCGYFVCLAMWMAALYTVPGNIVGGILLMGAAYAWLAAGRRASASSPTRLAAEPATRENGNR